MFGPGCFGGKLVGSAASRMDATWKRPYTQYSISMSNMHMAATSLPVQMTCMCIRTLLCTLPTGTYLPT